MNEIYVCYNYVLGGGIIHHALVRDILGGRKERKKRSR